MPSFKGREIAEIEVYNPHDEEGYSILNVEINWSYDSGYWRNSNGDGLPPSFDYDFKILSAYGSDDNPIPIGQWINEEQLSKDVDKIIDEYIEKNGFDNSDDYFDEDAWRD